MDSVGYSDGTRMATPMAIPMVTRLELGLRATPGSLEIAKLAGLVRGHDFFEDHFLQFVLCK